MFRHWNIMIGLVYQRCFDQIFIPRVCNLVNLKFSNDSLDVLQHYHWKYSVTDAEILRAYRFQQKPPETQKDIIVIFEERSQTSTETYLEQTHISKMELFVKMANGLKPFLNYVLRNPCHRCWMGCEHAFHDWLNNKTNSILLRTNVFISMKKY